MERLWQSVLDALRDFSMFLQNGDRLAFACMITLGVMFLALVAFTFTRKKEWVLVMISAGLYMIPFIVRGMHLM